MQFPISLGLRRSKLLVFLLVFLHAVAAVGVGVLPWALVWRGLLLVLVGGSLAVSLRSSGIAGLCLAARDRLECVLADGRRVPVRVLPDSTVYSWMIILRLRLDTGRARALVLMPDQATRDELRCLRLWLRWQSQPDEPKDGGGDGA